MRKRTFLISPVRGLSENDRMAVAGIADQLVADGWDVYWPYYDTNQDDLNGLWICMDNLNAIKRADAVHVVWDGQSQGCLFDLGMAFALHKSLYVVSIPELTEGKSFQNMMSKWSDITTK
jgi:nucleoside 2-deoxyribosyltransferase